MLDQVTMFDVMPIDQSDIESLSVEDLVGIVGMSVDLPFIYDKEENTYIAKIDKVQYRLRYGKYRVEPYKKYISCSYIGSNEGCSAPCDSVDEAIAFFRDMKER